MQTHPAQAQAQPQSPAHSPSTLEQFILDHEQRLQAIAAGHDQIVGHLNQLSGLRQQQKAESDRANASHKTEIASLRSYIWLCIAGVVGTALLSLTSSIFQSHQINLLQERLNVQPRQSSVQTRKN